MGPETIQADLGTLAERGWGEDTGNVVILLGK